MSPNTCLSWKVLEDLGSLFDEGLEIRDEIKGTRIWRGTAETKLRGKKSDTSQAFKPKQKDLKK